VAIANAKVAYASYQRMIESPRWKALVAKGARPQRLLWASTSTKNPDYRDVVYVEELIGPNTVNTMPLATLEAFADHGIARRTVDEKLDEARAELAALKELGIDLDAVTAQLETEGIEKFETSFNSLIKTVEEKVAQVARA
jgi:transaldolase